MDNFRVMLFFALVIILMLLWQAWEEHNRPPATAKPATSAPTATPPPRDVPSAPTAPSAPGPAPATAAVPAAARESSGARIQILTDLYEAVVDTQGGDLRSLKLRQYPVSVDKPKVPFVLFSDEDANYYIAQSGIIGHEGSFPTHKVRYQAAGSRYELVAGQDELRVPLSWHAPDGVRYTKTYVFKRDRYQIDVEFNIENATTKPWRGFHYVQLVRLGVAPPGIFAIPTFTGAAMYTPEDKYQKISFEDIAKSPLKREVTGGWVAMLQHYFVGAWMPGPEARSQFYTDRIDAARYSIGYTDLTGTELAPGASAVVQARLYAGPKEQRRLEKLVEGMDLTVDYGWLTIISAPLFWLLDWIHSLIGNWGWAIVVLTLLIKLVFYPLSAASYRSMAKMKKVQPKMQALKERYGDDKQKFQQAMMELYKTEKINPLGGCLPILIQIPVFIALYWVLLESVEMRQAPWVGWIRDLSLPDPYYVLPIVMGVSMYAQHMLNPQPLDPIQKKVFMVMPAGFTVLFVFFPAGLVLYWTVNNILSIAQQWQINRSIGVDKAKP